MTRYWVISPYYSKSDIFEKVWEYDRKNNLISIGWNKLGDVSGLDESTLKKRIREAYEGRRNLGYVFNQLQKFYQDIKKGDIVIARRGMKIMLATGKVTQTAFYDETKGKESVGDITGCYYYPNFIGVEWNSKPMYREFNEIIFPRFTLQPI